MGSEYTDYKNSGAGYDDGTLNTGSIGFKFNLPLYSGGAVDSRVKQAQFNYVSASEALEKNYRSIQADLYRSYNDVNGAIGSVRAYQQSVISAQSALTATRAGYEVGTRTVVDLLDATTVDGNLLAVLAVSAPLEDRDDPSEYRWSITVEVSHYSPA